MLRLLELEDLDGVLTMCDSGIHPDKHLDVYKLTPLVKACCWFRSHSRQGIFQEQKWLAVIKKLLEKGSDPNHKSCNMGTPLIATVKNLYSGSMILPKEVVRLLISFGANVNGDPNTLHFAVQAIHIDLEVLKLLLQHGICQTNKRHGTTPLEFLKKREDRIIKIIQTL